MIYIFRDAGCYSTNATNIGQNRTRKIPKTKGDHSIRPEHNFTCGNLCKIESRSWRSKVKRSSFHTWGVMVGNRTSRLQIRIIATCAEWPEATKRWARMHVEINGIEVYKTYLILFIELSGKTRDEAISGRNIYRGTAIRVGIFGPDRNLRWGEFRPPVCPIIVTVHSNNGLLHIAQHVRTEYSCTYIVRCRYELS